MKKLTSKAGFTLIEMLASILIMVFLIIGMDQGMEVGMRLYTEARFQANSVALAGTLNTAMSDILRSSTYPQTDDDDNVLSFNNRAFDVTYVHFGLSDETSGGIIQLLKSDGTFSRDLINAGSYPKMIIKEITCKYTEPEGSVGKYEVAYTIQSTEKPELTLPMTLTVRKQKL